MKDVPGWKVTLVESAGEKSCDVCPRSEPVCTLRAANLSLLQLRGVCRVTASRTRRQQVLLRPSNAL